MKRHFHIAIYICILISFAGCKKLFDYSPYETTLADSYKNTMAKNLDRISSLNSSFHDSSFTIGLLSDIHYHYDDLRTMVNKVNEDHDIDFVIITGDLTDGGLIDQFRLLHDILDNLAVPYLTVIGNHDYLASGETIYDEMFGARNYSLEFANTKLVLFDDVFWESGTTPDFSWFQNQLAGNANYNHTIVFSHIPPYTDQFDDASETIYKSAIFDNHVAINISGHQHGYDYKAMYPDSIPYVVVPTVQDHMLLKLRVGPTEVALSTSSY